MTPGNAPMHEIRLAGRGGQGVVTAGDLLGKAAVLEGKHAQSVPTFGPERRGAMSACTLRVSDSEILLKCSSTSPDVLCVLDPTIWHHVNVTLGLREGGKLIFNSPRTPEELAEELATAKHGYSLSIDRYELFSVDATTIALEAIGRPITNTAMMGALVGAIGVVEMASIEKVLMEKFGKRGEMNIKSATAASASLRRLGD
jgi:2-oxoacid:acceptor oxidoreductase gamma subunit (pyruvate/2-ketoisovalerate family)